MPDMKIDSALVDVIYSQLYDYYMLLESSGQEIPLDLIHAMRTIEIKFRRYAERAEYRQKKGYR